MYVELELESNPKEPIAGDVPPVPGADISVRSHLETTTYRNCWCIEIEDLDELQRLTDGSLIEVHPPVHIGTDALVRIFDGPHDEPAVGAARSAGRRPTYG